MRVRAGALRTRRRNAHRPRRRSMCVATPKATKSIRRLSTLCDASSTRHTSGTRAIDSSGNWVTSTTSTRSPRSFTVAICTNHSVPVCSYFIMLFEAVSAPSTSSTASTSTPRQTTLVMKPHNVGAHAPTTTSKNSNAAAGSGNLSFFFR